MLMFLCRRSRSFTKAHAHSQIVTNLKSHFDPESDLINFSHSIRSTTRPSVMKKRVPSASHWACESEICDSNCKAEVRKLTLEILKCRRSSFILALYEWFLIGGSWCKQIFNLKLPPPHFFKCLLPQKLDFAREVPDSDYSECDSYFTCDFQFSWA